MKSKLGLSCFLAVNLLNSHSVRGAEETELEEITVISSRIGKRWIDSSGSVYQVTAEDLVREGAMDLGALGKYDPTISLPFDFASGDGAYAYGQSGYGSINIRGAEGNRIAIELDGIRQPPQYVSTSFDMGSGDGAGGIGRDYFDPAMFEMIEVLKGGASALYGSDALGGVVSFKTPDPANLLGDQEGGGLLRTQYFSVNESFAGQAGGAVRSGNTSAMLLWAYRNGSEVANNGREAPNPLEFDSNSLLLKVEHVAGDHLFKVALEGFQRDSFADVKSAVNSAFPVFTDHVYNEQMLERLRGSLRWEYDAKASWMDRSETHLYWQYAGSRSDSDSASKPIRIGGVPVPGSERTREQSIQFDTTISGLSGMGTKELGDSETFGHTLIAGYDLSLETGENRFERTDNGVPSDRTSFSPTDTFRAGFYVQDEVSIAKKWFITGGLRLDWQTIKPDPNQAYLDRLADLGRFGQVAPEDYENLSISPRLNIAYKPNDWLQWYGSYAHGVRNPSAEELSMVFDHPPDGSNPVGSLTVPNPDLQEEKSDAFEIGVKGEGEAGRFQIAGFYTRYNDFIENGVLTGDVDDDGRDISTTVNRGEAEIFGFELGGRFNLAHWWTDAAGWEIGMSTGKSVGINRTDDTWLNSVEPWKTIGYIGYDHPDGKFGARLTGIYTAAVEHVDDSTNQGRFYRPPSWFTLDMGVYWRPQKTLTIHAGLNNLFDEKYWAWGSVRRGNGHLGGSATSDRSTAPGRNFSISLTKTF